MRTLGQALNQTFPDDDTWPRHALAGLGAQVSMDMPIADLAVGRMWLLTDGAENSVPTLLILAADRLVFGQTAQGRGGLRWLPLESINNIDAIDDERGRLVHYELLLSGNIVLALQAPDGFVSSLVTVLTGAPTAEPRLADMLTEVADDASALDDLGPASLRESDVPVVVPGAGDDAAVVDEPLVDRVDDDVTGECPVQRFDEPMAATEPAVVEPAPVEPTLESRPGDPVDQDDLTREITQVPRPMAAAPIVEPPAPAEPTGAWTPDVDVYGIDRGPSHGDYAPAPDRFDDLVSYDAPTAETDMVTPISGVHGIVTDAAPVAEPAPVADTTPVYEPHHVDTAFAPTYEPHHVDSTSAPAAPTDDAEVLDEWWSQPAPADGLVWDEVSSTADGTRPDVADSYLDVPGPAIGGWEAWPEGAPNVAAPAGYSADEMNPGVDDFADLGTGFDPTGGLDDLPAPAESGMQLMNATETVWWESFNQWPDEFRSVTYLGGHPRNPKRRKNIGVGFSETGLKASASGFGGWELQVPWNRVRSLDIEGSDELMFRSSLRIDLSSTAIVVDTDEGTLFFECRLRRPASVRSALAPLVNAMGSAS